MKDKIDRNSARKLIDELGIDERVRTHSEGVAHRAEKVCELLAETGHKVDSEKVIISALLHDLGRTRSHGLDHGKVGSAILLEHNLKEIAEVVKVHALPQTAELPLEVKILIYADTSTGPEGDAIDPMKKLGFLQRLAEEWKNEAERALAKEAYEVKRRIVSEIDLLIKQAMSHA